MSRLIGVLTAGGDTPGLNAAIRALGKAAEGVYGFEVFGFKDGFRGLVQNRFQRLNRESLSDILTTGGTILGTSRDKPHKMIIAGKKKDMTDVIVHNYQKHHLECLVCLGGGGTQKNAYKLHQKGLNIITLPKTIDNDVAYTDVTFGFDTAMTIACEAIDRLHTTAHSHHRIIVVETMGHKVGWLALGAGLSSGADVILIPEIPYDEQKIANAILGRIKKGKRFSIIAAAEGAISKKDYNKMIETEKIKKNTDSKEEKKEAAEKIKFLKNKKNRTLELANSLEKITGLESRVTILGHLQRGGTPTPADRLLATRLGTKCADYINDEKYGVMIGVKADSTQSIPLEKVAGEKKRVPIDHPWVVSARKVGTCLGD